MIEATDCMEMFGEETEGRAFLRVVYNSLSVTVAQQQPALSRLQQGITVTAIQQTARGVFGFQEESCCCFPLLDLHCLLLFWSVVPLSKRTKWRMACQLCGVVLPS